MISINNVSGEIVLSKGEDGYSEVIEDFKNASSITIVTFNISPKRNYLLNKLHELSAEKEVTIITKIPSRLGWYWNESIKTTTLEQMETYCSRLDPNKFTCHLSTFFNFENHAKIIMTENIAYIGSQNFSDESKNNFESGIIIRDVEVIKQIKNQMIKEILDASIPYSSSYFYLHKNELLYWLNDCRRIVEEFYNELFTEAEVGYNSYIEIFCDNPNIKENDWENIISYHEEFFSILDYIETNNSRKLEKSSKSKLKKLKQALSIVKNELAEIAKYNPDTIETAEKDARYYSADPEDVEKAIQAAMDSIYDQRSDIVYDMRSNIEEIKITLSTIPTLLEYLINSIKNHKFYTNSEEINNTGLSSKIILDRE